jgi:hypothetical protein
MSDIPLELRPDYILGYAAGLAACRLLPGIAQSEQEPVGEAGSMPGTTGFTMACFPADTVPVGTKIYTHPAQQAKSAQDEVRKDEGEPT